MTSKTINIRVDLDALIEFYGKDAPYWGNYSVTPLDVIEFCRFEGPEWKTGLSTVTEIHPETEYVFHFTVHHSVHEIESAGVNPNILFKMIYTQQSESLAVLTDIFSEDLDPLVFNGVIAELEIKFIGNQQITNSTESTWQAKVKTQKKLPEAAVIRYAVTFNFIHGGITRYCQIDPLIRTTSGVPRI
ncbi:MAG: hypothetical protein ACPGJS_02670 [Flammeovirgaceae bacterium]